MRRKSAWLAILLSISTATAVSVVACSPDSTAPAADAASIEERAASMDRKISELRDKYGWVGKYHTDGLEFIFIRLQQKVNKSSKKADFCRIAAKALKEFHRETRKGEVPPGLVDPSLINETCEDTGDSDARIALARIAGTPRLTAELSPAAVNYMNAVYDAITGATTRSGLVSTLHNIQYAAVSNLSGEEAGAVVAVVSIAFSSMDYWEANLDSWLGLTGTATPYSRAGEDNGFQPVAGPTMNGGSRWWNPYNRAFAKVLLADAVAGGRVLATSWMTGPIGWDAAAAAALWSSVSMTVSLMF